MGFPWHCVDSQIWRLDFIDSATQFISPFASNTCQLLLPFKAFTFTRSYVTHTGRQVPTGRKAEGASRTNTNVARNLDPSLIFILRETRASLICVNSHHAHCGDSFSSQQTVWPWEQPWTSLKENHPSTPSKSIYFYVCHRLSEHCITKLF